MKKLFLMMTALLALSLISCDSGNNYKAKGEEMANRLDQLCKQQDSVAVLALDDSIRAMEQTIIATGDSTAIKEFRQALKESREHNAAYISVLKVKKGTDNNEVAKEMAEDVMKGNMNINAVTESIDKMLEEKKEKE